MIPPGWLKQIRRIELRTIRLVENLMAGQYHSVFRGRGLDFEEVREYQAGDDVRSIDWNVTARQGRPFVKRFVEERELTLFLLLDRSPSMHFGTVRASKIQVAAETCALLAFAALRSHDRMALLTFGDGELRYLRPAKGKRQALRLVGEALASAAAGRRGVGLVEALDHLGLVSWGRGLVCVLSDFSGSLPVRSLTALAARHDVVAIAVNDPAERELPAAGLLRLADPGSGVCQLVDTGSQAVRSVYRQRAAQLRSTRNESIRSAGVDLLELDTSTPPIYPLMRFFQRRHKSRPA